MLTTLNILAILLGMTIVGLIGYLVVKTIINQTGKPTPPTPPPSDCSSTSCGECTTVIACNEQSDCLYNETSKKCINRSAPPPPPPISPGCSSSECSKCTDVYSCSTVQDDCVYDEENLVCIDKSCNISQDERINAPICNGNSKCSNETVCIDSPGNPCFQKTNSNSNQYPSCYVRNGKLCRTPPSLTTPVNVNSNTLTCASAEAGGSGKCSDLVPNNLPQKVTLSTKVINADTPMIQQMADTYDQYWTTIKGGDQNKPHCESGNSSWYCGDLNSNTRAIAVTVPTTKAPSGGYPYVLSWQFMDSNGFSTGWKQDAIGGLAEMTLNGGALTDDAGSGLASYMLMLKYIVSAGYVLVNISELVYDTEFWMECKPRSKSVDKMCWNDGNNVDADALRVLFDKIKNNNLIPNLNLKLDYDNMAALGYSVGAQMVSRMINNFPFMKNLSGEPMPTIKLGIMIGGGSYWCYNYDNQGGMDKKKLPSNYLPCANKDIGCCPNNRTEDNYDKGGKLQNAPHPPVLLLQGEQDMFASWEASSNYFNLLSSRGDPVYRVTGPKLQELNYNGRHGVYACQIPSIVALLQLYLK
jgi:hypothetical protein